LLRYDYQWLGGPGNIYNFETQSGILYEVALKKTDYLFGLNSPFSEQTFEFSILVAHNPKKSNPGYDRLVAPTISAILINFFEINQENIVIYICDSADRRPHLRKIKFDRWFDLFKGENFLKIDDFIKDQSNENYPVSLIIKRQNPNKIEIVTKFLELIVRLNSGK